MYNGNTSASFQLYFINHHSTTQGRTVRHPVNTFCKTQIHYRYVRFKVLTAVLMYIQTLSETWETNPQSVIVQKTWPFKLQLQSSYTRPLKKEKKKKDRKRKKDINKQTTAAGRIDGTISCSTHGKKLHSHPCFYPIWSSHMTIWSVHTHIWLCIWLCDLCKYGCVCVCV
jgi:hypothetical protein